jgi:hypothetical protein
MTTRAMTRPAPRPSVETRASCGANVLVVGDGAGVGAVGVGVGVLGDVVAGCGAKGVAGEASKRAWITVADPALKRHVGLVAQTPTQRANVDPGLGSALRLTRAW